MVKHKHTPPVFLQRKLDTATAAYAKEKLPAFLEQAKKDNNGEWLPTKELLLDFVVHLGQFSKKWKNIEPLSLSTGYDGVYSIYDMIRKKTKTLDEKKVPTPKPTPDKGNTKFAADKTTKKEADQQIKETPGDVVQVTAGHHDYRFDERSVGYRKNLDKQSAGGLTEHDAISSRSKRISKSSQRSFSSS